MSSVSRRSFGGLRSPVRGGSLWLSGLVVWLCLTLAGAVCAEIAFEGGDVDVIADGIEYERERQLYTASGRVQGEGEKITVDEALYAITLGAAYTLHLDSEVGSIECGKRADFAVLDEDPTKTDPMELKDIPVWGTVQGGRVFNSANL